MTKDPAPSTAAPKRAPGSEAARGRPVIWAAGSLVLAWAYLFFFVGPSLGWAGVSSPLPWAAWLLGVCAAVAPWVITGFGDRGRRAVVGQLGALLAVGAMMFSPVAGALLGLVWILLVQIAGRFAPHA